MGRGFSAGLKVSPPLEVKKKGQVKSGQVISSQIKSGQVRSSRVKSGQVRSNQVKSKSGL